MYSIVIVDDEPLVQIGLKSILSRGFTDTYTVTGTAANGRDALEIIAQEHPDIVISDIKMPVMNGLELLAKCHERFGALPVFIMLTAYEEFDLARQALANDACDYLVKIELNNDTLAKALDRAKKRVDEHRAAEGTSGVVEPASLDEFREKFLLKLFSRGLTDRDQLEKEGHDVGLFFDRYNRYICVYCQIHAEEIGDPDQKEEDSSRLLTLYASALSMTKEIVGHYLPCLTVSNDTRHFTMLFYFDEKRSVATAMNEIEEAITNANEMILSYFNVPLWFGVGTAVSDPLEIPTSYEEAKTAEGQADDQNPVRLFSHIVGANRRSGKDKLIASIQDYIDKNLNGKLQLTEVASAFGLSPAYLSVIFKKNTDVGFSEYVQTRKIEKAREMLLSGDMKIYEVADALGFESAYYFSKVFKKIDGHSPREYIQSKTE